MNRTSQVSPGAASTPPLRFFKSAVTADMSKAPKKVLRAGLRSDCSPRSLGITSAPASTGKKMSSALWWLLEQECLT